MFTVLISFPQIMKGKETEFLKWFEISNEQYSYFNGFRSRKLLKPIEEGCYAAIVEMESEERFENMHRSAIHEALSAQAKPLFLGKPEARFYEVVTE